MDQHRCRNRHRSSSIMFQTSVLLFIAVSAFPLICSSATTTGADSSSAGKADVVNSQSGNNNNHPHHHHHQQPHRLRHQSRTIGARADHGSGSEQPTDETAPKVFSGYTDSYITRKAALELQEKLKQLHHPATDEEYDALLQKLVTKPKSDPSFTIYNKKYYDYLPSESTEAKNMEELVTDLEEYAKNKRKRPFKKVHPHLFADLESEQGERRSKRSVAVDDGDHEIRKRQTGTGVWPNQFHQRQETRRSTQHFVSNADHQLDDHPAAHYTAAAANTWAAPPYHSTAFVSSYNSPWPNRLYNTYVPQRPSNYYLPVVPPSEYTQFIVRPHQPWMRFPIPGVVYNPAFPPKNPPAVTGLRPGVSVIHPDTNSIAGSDKDDGNTDIPNRFGAGDDDDDRFIFDVEERTQAPPARRPVRPFSQSPPQSPRFTTRRPPPPLIRDSDNADDTQAAINNIFGNNRPAFNRPSVNAQQPRPTTRRPPPPLIHNSDDNEAGQSTNQQGNSQPESFSNLRPFILNPTRAPVAATTSAPIALQDEEPSRCVWAIVNCCSPSNRQVRYSCFERFGCAGAFWDINPCNEDVFDSAVDAADKYLE